MAALSPHGLHFKPRGSHGHCPLFSIDLLYHQSLIYHNLTIPGINLTSKPTVTLLEHRKQCELISTSSAPFGARQTVILFVCAESA